MRKALTVAMAAAAIFGGAAGISSAQDEEATSSGFRCEKYGYVGYFKHPCSKIRSTNWWNTGRLESFGIAPDRTIWHAWPGSGGWREMPHNGRADEVVKAIAHSDRRTRTVVVRISNGDAWQSTDPGNGHWGPWRRYP
ncbi:hypothetical protein NDR87_21545 [Nocardia sp. CDC159]|uniref:Peptidase inhibitor family I36 n=1 Tax=Nocardia pulmonis TaxID=2951408 RepID=A0A9X2J121_9NOCA|nr:MULTISPECIES: hypothetical protein [Nocardia]MCM6776531.1 hypothetical protein [Nocardia pulmonis]MCM6788955.1 hypothetical protein [Nocardia sp. CDC159]